MKKLLLSIYIIVLMFSSTFVHKVAAQTAAIPDTSNLSAENSQTINQYLQNKQQAQTQNAQNSQAQNAQTQKDQAAQNTTTSETQKAYPTGLVIILLVLYVVTLALFLITLILSIIALTRWIKKN